MRRSAALVSGCVLLLAGCGSPAASKPPAPARPSPTPGPTPIPANLVSYAQTVVPIMKLDIQSIRSLRSTISSNTHMDVVAAKCSDEGGALDTDSTSVESISEPVEARSYFGFAVRAYNTALTATTDCGTAADTVSKSGLSAADREFASAEKDLTSATDGVSKWLPAR
jgi:hypothetical protein